MPKVLLIFLVLYSSCTFTKEPKIQQSSDFEFTTLLAREDVIWGFDFLPDGKVILTERSGKMLVFNPKDNKAIELKGVPKVHAVGQGGLLDVRAHPDFKNNQLIYFSYSEPVKDLSTTALGLGKLAGQELTEVRKIFSGHEPNGNDIHYGSRIEFDGKGHLFLTMGDRDNRERAQDLSFHQGKILRLNLDGSVPKDNPFVNKKGARPEIWSLGHRSPQGLVRHPQTGELWEAEMGPRGGDEINLIQESKNYGWPLITYGREYYGPKIGEKEKSGLEQPVTFWVPSISPSAITFYQGDQFPQWKNQLFIANLSGSHVRRLVMAGVKILEQHELLGELEYRWRNLRTGPDGYLYLSTDEGRFGKITKK